MSKKRLIVTLVVIALGTAIYFGFLRGIPRILAPVPPRDTPPVATTTPSGVPAAENTTGIPLTLPPGFSISVFAKDLPGARVMVFDQFGNMWVSQTSQGLVSTLEIQDGKVVRQGPVLRNLDGPHGLALAPNSFMLYMAEETKISRVPLYSDGDVEKISDLPGGGGHSTRTLGFGPPSAGGSGGPRPTEASGEGGAQPDERLYVSIGSSCNVCHESDDRRAKIFTLDRDGKNLKEYARGLRNAVFFTWHPSTGKMWATEMGRDSLGDDIPPDEVNIVEEGKNYGWPICYGKNVHDDQFDKNTYARNPCMEPFEMRSHVDIPAHSAPLGLAFVPATGWPAEYADDLIVAYHGSWNRTVPTGYKLVRLKFSKDGAYEGAEDFVAGWQEGSKVHGRPAGILFGVDGALYVSDDKAGVIYKVAYTGT